MGNPDVTSRKRNPGTVTKADKIIETDLELVQRVNALSAELQKNNAKLESTLATLERTRQDGSHSSRQITEVYNSLHGEYLALKQEMKYLAAQNEIIYSEITKSLAAITSALAGGALPVSGTGLRADIDYDKLLQKIGEMMPKSIDYDALAAKVIEMMPPQEYVSPDYIACKVAEQIVVPGNVAAAPAAAPAEGYPEAAPVYSAPVEYDVDEEDLADRIALKIGSIKAEDFDIIVDDDGCDSISESLARKLDYEVISQNVAQKLRPALDALTAVEPDYEDMAARISEKITVAGINEDAIADKAAAALSNYLPEIDTDDIADKVASQVISSMPAVEVDGESISKSVSEKLIESQEGHDYDIVLDEEGISKLTEEVSGEVLKETGARFDSVERQIADLRELIKGAAIAGAAASVIKADEAESEEGLVTVSEVVEDGFEEAPEDAAMAEMVEEIDEIPTPAEAEIMPAEQFDGVDFEHMMKYNRSFIARIIQSTDEQKQYYGQVKTALLSYAKVNSNVAWGAERFNKGRETIARFKIRGKTLCLYLALDPAEYKTSVYHHADVSDNKSMHGTPMMVKIKSPLGVKKAIRLIDDMLEKRGGIKRNKVIERDYSAMYPYESIEELIEDGLVKDVNN